MTQQHRTSDPADTLRILHLSDPHLTASGFDEDGVDAARALGILMETLDDVDDVDLVITTGDIADDGSVEGCRRVRDVIGAFARQRGVPHVYTTGNHDRRASFVEVFGSGHLAADGTDVASVSGPAGICAAVSHVRGLRVVTVDSLVPGSGHGFVGEEQLGWLREVLATPAPRGTIVALHHPPVAVARHPLSSLLLRNPGAFSHALAGSDVRAVLCGHLHHEMSGTIGAVPVHVGPGIVTRIDLAAPAGYVKGVLGPRAAVVEMGAERAPITYTVTARDPRAGEEVYLVEFAAS
jgi:3',5'-cyclic AMP phosphodiesterase CpdA